MIIPVRNEEKNILNLLEDIQDQKEDLSMLEVIIIDDSSEDKTVQLVSQFQLKSRFNIQLVKLDPEDGSGKKYAITKGIQHARHEIIMLTDADCSIHPDWFHSLKRTYNSELMMQVGPVALTGNNYFSRLQTVEYACLMGFGAATLYADLPSMCSGANLLFKKSAFDAVGGYRDNVQIPSGDDEFLMFKVKKRFPEKVTFVFDQSRLIRSKAKSTFRGFLNQRSRWTSKWKYNRNPVFKRIVIAYFLESVIFVAALIGLVQGQLGLFPFFLVMLFRISASYPYVHKVTRFSADFNPFLYAIFLHFTYPFYVIFIGLNSLFGSYSWKGRRFYDRL
jgi:glycosyltransferase involved in cell wall biosynthesis